MADGKNTLQIPSLRIKKESTISLSAPSIHELLYAAEKRNSRFLPRSAKNSRQEYPSGNPELNSVISENPRRKASKEKVCLSAGNSPVLSKRIVSGEDKKSNIPSKLLMPNMDKFAIEVSCPGGELYRADIFKIWTSAQLSWKIAHAKGMAEKLALVIQEKITQLHLVRSLEDHECVYDVIQNWASDSSNSLNLVEDLSKFDLFSEPGDYLPSDLLEVGYANMLRRESDQTRHSLYSFIVKADTAVDVSHWIFVKDFDKKTWKKTYLRIKDSVLQFCDTDSKNDGAWETLYHCSESYVYHCLDEFKAAHKPPFPDCFCIIPCVVNKWKQIKCFSVESNKMFTGWLTAFRLAKYGQQLFKNYCEAMAKEEILCRTNSSHHNILTKGSRSFSDAGQMTDVKAAVDFSGNNSRVISDPLERLQIQNQLGFEIPRPVKRRSETFSPMAFRRAVLSNKVWYHGKVKREQAILKLKKNGLKDGMFLVRESGSCEGNLVLSVVKKDKIVHRQIFQVNSAEGKPMFGMQHGPKFQSLELFIEAYNSGTIEDFVLKKPCPPT